MTVPDDASTLVGPARDSAPGSERSDPVEIAERVRVMRDGVISYGGYVVSGLIGILLVPVYLGAFGAELYGLWLAALAVAALVSAFDFGLFSSVMREVALDRHTRSDAAARFVASAGTIFFLLGLGGAVVIGTIGLPLSSGLHLTEATRGLARGVFALAGLQYAAGTVALFAWALLCGLRRFGAIAWLSSASAVVGAVGTVGLVAVHAGLLTVIAWQILVTAGTAAAALALTARLEPRFGVPIGPLDRSLLRGHVSFSVQSQLVTGLVRIVWGTAPLLVGAIRGAGAIAFYHIGQRFPYAIADVTWRVSEVLFPAAADRGRTSDTKRARGILEVGTRWTVALALPLCIILWTVAPSLLGTWIGDTPRDSVGVLRLLTAGVLADAVGVAALHVLWAQGVFRSVLGVLGGAAVANLALGVWLVSRLGIVGAAWAFFVPSCLGSFALAHLAARWCAVPTLALVRATLRGLILPALACGVSAVGLLDAVRADNLVEVLGVAVAAGAAYAVSLYVAGAREEERVFAREAVGLPVTVARAVWRVGRRGFRRAEAPMGEGR
ncbi:MAG: hypothetical protein HY705_07130 [Gemmatimonadetes bacterium]|nr:hypothetical protein [Gemmatimonadota bacterium]